MKMILIFILSYLLGSIPFGYLIGRLMGEKDIRTKGSGNIGATNTLRVLGKKAGISVFALDFLKGLLAVRLALHFLPGESGLGVFCGLLPAMLGHNFPVWLGFKGGKGVAVSVGGLMGVSPLYAVLALSVFAVIVAASRYVSLASMIATAFGGSLIFFSTGLWGKIAAVLVVGTVIARHHGNISRLIKGEERRLGSKKK